MRLLVSGGFYKKRASTLRVGAAFDSAYLQEIDWPSGNIIRELLYKSPSDCIDPDFGMIFKSFEVVDDDLIIVPTSTEILFINRATFKIARRITNPRFNDLHHVAIHGGKLYVCNTGLDEVIVLGSNGKIDRAFNLASCPTWQKFSRSADYRFIKTTQPHEVHANYIFFLAGEPWVTRFLMKDAICLVDTQKKIDLNFTDGAPHDGYSYGGKIYFTLTDGGVVVVDQYSLKVVGIYNLNKMHPDKVQLGWCRGIGVVDRHVMVGFTSLRASKLREYGSWIKRGQKRLPARIAEFDLERGRLVTERNIQAAERRFEKGAAVFSVRVI